MKSRRFEKAKRPAASSPLDTPGPAIAPAIRSHNTRRQATVYDAVAGLVTTSSALPRHDIQDNNSRETMGQHKRPTLADATLPPEEVLFRRRQAPTRFAERDIYFAHEDLPPGALPDNDLLQAVHGYANRFYAQLGRSAPEVAPGTHQAPHGYYVGTRHVDERSMDETALLAFGILLEEAGREALGKRGDLVFTEGLREEAHDGLEGGRQEHRRSLSRGSVDGTLGLEEGTFWKRSYPKRRKIAPSESGETES